jgi:hypothetical protein
MIDHSDGDDFWLISLLTDNPLVGLIVLVIAIALWWAACDNEKICANKSCPNDAKPKLMDHACLCVTEAK